MRVHSTVPPKLSNDVPGLLTPHEVAASLRTSRKAIYTSRTAARRWGEARERHLLQHGPPRPKKEVPTLAEFKDRFLDGYARANRQKPSGIAANETVLGVHLVPLLGSTRLDDITTEDVQRLKHQLRSRHQRR